MAGATPSGSRRSWLACLLICVAIFHDNARADEPLPTPSEDSHLDIPEIGPLNLPDEDLLDGDALAGLATGVFDGNHTAHCKVTCNHKNITLGEGLTALQDPNFGCNGTFKAFCKPSNCSHGPHGPMSGFICEGTFTFRNGTNATVASCSGHAKKFAFMALPPPPHPPHKNKTDDPEGPRPDSDEDESEDFDTALPAALDKNHTHDNHTHHHHHHHHKPPPIAFKRFSCKGFSKGIIPHGNMSVEEAVASSPDLSEYEPASWAASFFSDGADGEALEDVKEFGKGPHKMISKCKGFGTTDMGVKMPPPPHHGPHGPPHHGPHHHHHHHHHHHPHGPPHHGPHHPHGPPHHGPHHKHRKDVEDEPAPEEPQDAGEDFGAEPFDDMGADGEFDDDPFEDIVDIPEDADDLEDFVDDTLEDDMGMDDGKSLPWVPELSHLFDRPAPPPKLHCNATCNDKDVSGKWPCHGNFSVNCTSCHGKASMELEATCKGFYSGFFGHICRGVSKEMVEATLRNGTLTVDKFSVCQGKHGVSAKHGPWGHGVMSWCKGKGMDAVKVEKEGDDDDDAFTAHELAVAWDDNVEAPLTTTE